MAVSPGAPCLVLGSGYIHLLAAKQAAIAGYKTYIFTATDPQPSLDLLYNDQCPIGSIPLEILSITDKDACEKAIQSCEAVILASDGVIDPPSFFASDNPVASKVLDTVIPEDGSSKVKHIVGMSRIGVSGRPGSGKGYGPTVQAAKDFSNSDVWAMGNVKGYKEFEDKIMEKATAVGADYTIVRAGSLKGGGSGAETAKGSNKYPHAEYALSATFYTQGMVPKPNWKLLFDMDIQGVNLLAGDTAVGPGFFAPTKSTSCRPEDGDSGRLAVASAMIQSLSQPAAANTDFTVTTAESRDPPTQGEWDKLFKAL